MTADEEANEPMHPNASNESTLVLALNGVSFGCSRKQSRCMIVIIVRVTRRASRSAGMVADTIRFPGLYRKRKVSSHGDAEFIVDYRSYAKALH